MIKEAKGKQLWVDNELSLLLPPPMERLTVNRVCSEGAELKDETKSILSQ